MGTEPKKIGLRMAAGIVIAITIIVAIFASGITLPGQEPPGIAFPNQEDRTGRLTILLKDAPVAVDELWINMTGLEVHKVGQDDEAGGWMPLWDENTKISFDLLIYQNDILLELVDVAIAQGNYTKIRMNVTEAEAWYYQEDESIKKTPLKVPSGKIDVIAKFEIKNYDHVNVLVDMEPDWIAISKNNNLRPVLKATISEKPLVESEIVEPTTIIGDE
jgi:hypothetical protein